MDRGMRALGRIGAAGTASGTPEDRLGEALEALRSIIPFAAVHVEAREVVRAGRTGPHGNWSTVCSDGYPSSVTTWLSGPGLQRDLKVTGGHRHRRPVRWRDVGTDPLELPTIGEYLHPHGFREGASAALYTRDDDWTGCLHLSLGDAAHPNDAEVAVLHGALPTFAELCRQVGTDRALEGRVQVLRRGPDGDITTTGGRRTGLPPAVLTAAAALADGQACLIRAEERWWRIYVLPTGPAARSGPVWVEHDPERRGLTDRELEVLGAVCEGWSNRRIAEHLGVTQRTVATHVERILVKLDTTTRAGAAAVAVGEGLRCRPAEP